MKGKSSLGILSKASFIKVELVKNLHSRNSCLILTIIILFEYLSKYQ